MISVNNPNFHNSYTNGLRYICKRLYLVYMLFQLIGGVGLFLMKKFYTAKFSSTELLPPDIRKAIHLKPGEPTGYEPWINTLIKWQKEGHGIWLKNNIWEAYTQFLISLNVYWLCLAVLGIAFIFGFIGEDMLKRYNPDIFKGRINPTRGILKNLTALLFIGLYVLLSAELLSKWVEFSRFTYFYEFHFVTAQHYNLRFFILYGFTLIFPILLFFIFESQVILKSLRTSQKFFSFNMILFTFYLFCANVLIANNIWSFYMSIEGISFCFIVLIAMIRNRVSYSVLISYVLQLIFCSGFMLLGLGLVYFCAKTYRFESICNLDIYVHEHGKDTPNAPMIRNILYAGVFSFLFGLAGKVGVFPFFRWPFDLYSTLPLPIIILSSIFNKVGILIPSYFILCFCFPHEIHSFNPILVGIIALASSSSIFAGLYSTGVKNSRELIAASGISQTSFIFFIILNPTYWGLIVVGLYILGYAIAVLVFCVYVFRDEPFDDKDDEKNIAKEIQPSELYQAVKLGFFPGWVTFTAFVCMVGFPPTSFFFSKITYLNWLHSQNYSFGSIFVVSILILFVVVTVLNIIIYVKFINKYNYKESEIAKRLGRLDFVLIWASLYMLAAVLPLSIFGWLYYY